MSTTYPPHDRHRDIGRPWQDVQVPGDLIGAARAMMGADQEWQDRTLYRILQMALHSARPEMKQGAMPGRHDPLSGLAVRLPGVEESSVDQAGVTMEDALTAGDGGLQEAIDYWQDRALRAEKRLLAGTHVCDFNPGCSARCDVCPSAPRAV